MARRFRLPGVLGLVVLVLSAVEFAVAAWVLLVGPVDVHVGSISLATRGVGRPVVFGTLAGSLALVLLEPLLSGAARSRLRSLAPMAAACVALVSLVPLLIPVLLPGFVVGHDSNAHQTYVFLMDRALSQGQLPVRWVEGTAPGLGQPLFNHYQVGFFYLVSAIRRLGMGLPLAYKLATVGAWVSGGAFVFLLCRRLGTLPALLAAMVFVWSPYLLVDAYVRAAYPELTAIACAAGVAWSLDGVMRTGRAVYVCALALTTALLLLSHLPTALIVGPVAAAYVLSAVALQPAKRRWIWLAGGGAALGAAMAAFYVVPAIAELPSVKIGRLTTAYFDYHRHFVRPEWWVDWAWRYGGPGDDARERLPVQIGVVQWLVLIAGVGRFGVLLAQRRRAADLVPIAGWLIIVAGAMFMMTAASALVWEHVAPLAFIQFPWRFLLLPTLACSVLAGTLLAQVGNRWQQALILICAVTVQWYVTRDPRQVAAYYQRAPQAIGSPAWPANEAERQQVFREAAYDPVSVTSEPGQAAAQRWSIEDGRAAVLVQSETDTRREYRVDAEGDARMVINSPFYPGWAVYVDGRPAAVSVMSGSGYMAVHVPPGTHRIDATFGRTTVRAAADSVTLAGAVAWAGIAVWAGWRRRSRYFGSAKATR